MRPEEKIGVLRNNDALRSDFIKEYTGFILSSASKTVGRYVSVEDDEYAVALIAFNEAIDRFDGSRGGFLSLAKTIIKSRLIDEARKQGAASVPFSSLEAEDEDGCRLAFEPVGAEDVVTEAQLEIAILKNELEAYDISFFDLPKHNPKSKKTKRECFRVIKYIVSNSLLKSSVLETGNIPVRSVVEQTGAGRKLLERHRKYIIASVVILSGDYPIVSGYIKNAEEV